MKNAVIVVGIYKSGKSKTINKYFKPLLRLSRSQKKFLNGDGIVLSQSIEKKRFESVQEFSARYGHYKYLVCATRPDGEKQSLHGALRTELEEKGYKVSTVIVAPQRPEPFYERKGSIIFKCLHFSELCLVTSQ